MESSSLQGVDCVDIICGESNGMLDHMCVINCLMVIYQGGLSGLYKPGMSFKWILFGA